MATSGLPEVQDVIFATAGLPIYHKATPARRTLDSRTSHWNPTLSDCQYHQCDLQSGIRFRGWISYRCTFSGQYGPALLWTTSWISSRFTRHLIAHLPLDSQRRGFNGHGFGGHACHLECHHARRDLFTFECPAIRRYRKFFLLPAESLF